MSIVDTLTLLAILATIAWYGIGIQSTLRRFHEDSSNRAFIRDRRHQFLLTLLLEKDNRDTVRWDELEQLGREVDEISSTVSTYRSDDLMESTVQKMRSAVGA